MAVISAALSALVKSPTSSRVPYSCQSRLEPDGPAVRRPNRSFPAGLSVKLAASVISGAGSVALAAASILTGVLRMAFTYSEMVPERRTTARWDHCPSFSSGSR